MSDINDENLPSIEDYSDSSDDLPSVSDFLTEEELPSIEDYIKEESGGSVEEDKITIDDAEGNAFIEVTDVVKAPEWSELVRLVNNVRESIPDIPEIKYYDKELKALEEEINQIRAETFEDVREEVEKKVDTLRKSIEEAMSSYNENISEVSVNTSVKIEGLRQRI